MLTSGAGCAFSNSEPIIAPPGACSPEPLNVLLTNDDGFDSQGITALHHALTNAGHRVKRIAPAQNHSGGGTALSIRPVVVAPAPSAVFTEIYQVDGTPATTVLVGATALFGEKDPVDLIVSGINEGANVGPATVVSGTVGATIVGARLLDPPIPGIAVSSDLLDDDPHSPANVEMAQQVAAFTGRLVAALQQAYCGQHAVLPPGVVLNVNHPSRPEGEIAGVRWTRQSHTRSFDIRFRAADDGRYVPVLSRLQNDTAPNHAPADADTELFAAGFITIVVLDGDYSVDPLTVPGLETLPSVTD